MEHFIIEFSEESDKKRFSKLYYPLDVYKEDDGWCCDRGLVESHLYILYMERSGRGDELEC